MHPEALAEITLAPSRGPMPSATSLQSWGFIVSFGRESFSAVVLPSGSGALAAGKPQQLLLRFRVRDVEPFLKPAPSPPETHPPPSGNRIRAKPVNAAPSRIAVGQTAQRHLLPRF
jgi:hypothetical protein